VVYPYLVTLVTFVTLFLTHNLLVFGAHVYAVTSAILAKNAGNAARSLQIPWRKSDAAGNNRTADGGRCDTSSAYRAPAARHAPVYYYDMQAIWFQGAAPFSDLN
jgi:hypothetical protein